jgi:hypothetical protein
MKLCQSQIECPLAFRYVTVQFHETLNYWPMMMIYWERWLHDEFLRRTEEPQTQWWFCAISEKSRESLNFLSWSDRVVNPNSSEYFRASQLSFYVILEKATCCQSRGASEIPFLCDLFWLFPIALDSMMKYLSWVSETSPCDISFPP